MSIPETEQGRAVALAEMMEWPEWTHSGGANIVVHLSNGERDVRVLRDNIYRAFRLEHNWNDLHEAEEWAWKKFPPEYYNALSDDLDIFWMTSTQEKVSRSRRATALQVVTAILEAYEKVEEGVK